MRLFCIWTLHFRSSFPEVFLEKGILKICSKFTGEHPCRIAISIKLQSNFIEIALWYGCSSVNLLHIFRKSSPENTSGGLLLSFEELLRKNHRREVTLNFHFSLEGFFKTVFTEFVFPSFHCYSMFGHFSTWMKELR